MDKTMNLKILRKLAKSDKFQILYNRAKELGSLKLFRNDSDLSKIQTWFLYFLEMYNVLYRDLSENKDYITEEVIQDDIRTDAYLLLRKTEKSKKNNKNEKEVNTSGDMPSIIFREK